VKSWDVVQGQLINRAIVPKTQLASDDGWIVVDCLSEFGNVARTEGGLRLDELPPEISWNSEVTNAAGQIGRNGPSTYIYNVLLQYPDNVASRRMENTKAGLHALADQRRLGVYEEICAAFRRHREDFLAEMKVGRHFTLSNNNELFRGFSNSAEDDSEFLSSRAQWVRSLKIVFPVPDEVLKQQREKLWSANPLRDLRLTELKLRAEEDERELQKVWSKQAQVKKSLFKRVFGR
jgi:hypothetical protein